MIKDIFRNNKLAHKLYDNIMTIFFRCMPKISTKVHFFFTMGYHLSLKNPQTFNEKINWLKFNDNVKLKTECADKYLVRTYVAGKGFDYILNELFFLYEETNEIKFEELPTRFVLKTNHSCGTNIIVNNKETIDEGKIKATLEKWLNKKYGYYPYEPQYLNINPKILCEKNLCDKDGEAPEDYKFYCSKGKLLMFSIINRLPKPHLPEIYHFDENKQFIEASIEGCQNIPAVPSNIDKMIDIAKKLSADFKFVRVDLYSIGGKIIFGELTFTPTGGFYNYISKDLDLMMGKKLDLN